MMGRQSRQISMLVLEIEELIPANHLLRPINQLVSFDSIYDLVAPYYPANGRPSVDPVSMFKVLLGVLDSPRKMFNTPTLVQFYCWPEVKIFLPLLDEKFVFPLSSNSYELF